MKLASAEVGDGPPVIILHGLFGSGRNWATVARKLSASHRVIALDLRNHGDSPWAATMTYGEMADDVAEFIAASGLERPSVIGHSMGGKVAMILALGRDIALDALVVVDIAPVPYGSGFAHYVEALSAIDLSSIERRSDADEALSGAVTDPNLRAFLLQNLVARNETYVWRINLSAIEAGLTGLSQFPLTGSETAFAGPALFVAGERSGYVAPEHHGTIREYFPRANFAVLDGAGHWPHAERPGDFLSVVESFLDRRPR
jgi:pimeloyl-ACP methyl ester carboxylesterase